MAESECEMLMFVFLVWWLEVVFLVCGLFVWSFLVCGLIGWFVLIPF